MSPSLALSAFLCDGRKGDFWLPPHHSSPPERGLTGSRWVTCFPLAYLVSCKRMGYSDWPVRVLGPPRGGALCNIALPPRDKGGVLLLAISPLGEPLSGSGMVIILVVLCYYIGTVA